MKRHGEGRGGGSHAQRALSTGVMTGWVIALMLIAGGFIAGTVSAVDQPPAKPEVSCPYINDAAAIAEGKKLFNKNCAECHGDGTGGSGPDLTDNEWLCGGSDYQIFVTILKGRPAGMPSWSGDLKDDEVWKIIAYIRSLKK